LPSKNNSSPGGAAGKLQRMGSVVPAGLGFIFAHNPQLKLRAIFKRLFAADRAAGMDAVDVREIIVKSPSP